MKVEEWGLGRRGGWNGGRYRGVFWEMGKLFVGVGEGKIGGYKGGGLCLKV